MGSLEAALADALAHTVRLLEALALRIQVPPGSFSISFRKIPPLNDRPTEDFTLLTGHLGGVIEGGYSKRPISLFQERSSKNIPAFCQTTPSGG